MRAARASTCGAEVGGGRGRGGWLGRTAVGLAVVIGLLLLPLGRGGVVASAPSPAKICTITRACWTSMATVNPTRPDVLRAVSCTSASSCMAVGSATTGNTTEALAEQWNGAS